MQRHYSPTARLARYGIACLVAGLAVLSGCVAEPTVVGEPLTPIATGAAADSALPAPGLSRVLVKLWQKPDIFTDVRIVDLQDNVLYLAGAPRSLEAVNIATGVPLWVHPGTYPVDQAPTQRENTLYVVEGGQFVTLRLPEGVETSRSRTRVGVTTPLFPAESLWMVGSTNDRVHGILPGTGVNAWHQELDDYILAGMWDRQRLAYFLTRAGSLYGFNVPTQTQAWVYTFRKPNCSLPALDNGMILIGNEDYFLYAINAQNGTELWRMGVGAPALDKPVPAGDRVYVYTADDVLHAIDMKTQKEIWTASPGGHVLTSTNDRVVFHRRVKGINYIGIVDAATGKPILAATALGYERFVGVPGAGVFYAISKRGDVLALADRDMLIAREEAEEAAARSAVIKPIAPPAETAPTAPVTPK